MSLDRVGTAFVLLTFSLVAQVLSSTGLFDGPELVHITGYQGDAMEPFLSPDGRYLFFNNRNDARTDTNLYFAERAGGLTFRYLGELPGVNSPALDAVASVDRAGHFYFISTREYERTGKSIFTGQFDGRRVRDARPLEGDLGVTGAGVIYMDASVSPDGDALYLSRAVFVPGASGPKRSELLVARRAGSAFHIDPDSARLMANINSGDLEYAAAISADAKQLYFTRTSLTIDGPRFQIMVAMRDSLHAPFAAPRALSQIAGFVEAPSLSLDGRELFFHREVDGRFAIWRAVRR